MSDKLKNLSDDELDELSELIIQKMTQRAYIEVGKKVVSLSGKFFFYVGVASFAIYSVLKSKGIIS